MTQYYYVTMRSNAFWNNDERIIVKSKKQLKEYVTKIMEYLPYGEVQYEYGKRISESTIYQDLKNGKSKKVGYVFTRQTLNKSKNCDEIELWCTRITRKNWVQYSGFKGVE